jgi:nicotinamidase-related amidase
MDPRTSALLVVDLQNDTVGEQGAFAADGAAAFASRHGVLERAERLVGAARAVGMPVVVCGAWTNFAIEHTCRDGADYGYEVVLAADATATIADDWQDAALSYALTRIADVRKVDDLVAELDA